MAWLVAWTTVESSRSFSSAEISPGGYRVISTPDTSASVSRRRLTASCMSRATSGDRASSTKPNDRQDRLGPAVPAPALVEVAVACAAHAPPQQADAQVGEHATTPTIVTARVDTRMS